MTLMDAPKYDAVGARRHSILLYGFVSGFLLVLVVAWLLVGHPLDGPWNWWTYWAGTRATEQFLQEVESGDMTHAFATWVHDPDWEQHTDKFKSYPFDRFKEDWGADSSANDYGTISSHRVVVKKMYGSVLVVGSMINGRKSRPLFLAYDKKAHTLGFSPLELTVDQQ